MNNLNSVIWFFRFKSVIYFPLFMVGFVVARVRLVARDRLRVNTFIPNPQTFTSQIWDNLSSGPCICPRFYSRLCLIKLNGSAHGHRLTSKQTASQNSASPTQSGTSTANLLPLTHSKLVNENPSYLNAHEIITKEWQHYFPLPFAVTVLIFVPERKYCRS